MQWPPVMAWTSLFPYKGEKYFVAVNYSLCLEDNEKWVDMVSIIDGEIFLRVIYKELNDLSMWLPGWTDVKENITQAKEKIIGSRLLRFNLSSDAGLSIPFDSLEYRPWFPEK